MYVFEDPEPNGEVEQHLMMELDYRTLCVHVEMCLCVCVHVCACVCVCMYAYNWYKCVFMCLSTCCYLLQIGPFSFCTFKSK